MGQVGARLRERCDPEVLRRGTCSKPLELRKNEPHPVAYLRPRAELGAHPGEHPLLGEHETMQLVRVVALGRFAHGLPVPTALFYPTRRTDTSRAHAPPRARTPPRTPSGLFHLPCARADRAPAAWQRARRSAR